MHRFLFAAMVAFIAGPAFGEACDVTVEVRSLMAPNVVERFEVPGCVADVERAMRAASDAAEDKLVWNADYYPKQGLLILKMKAGAIAHEDADGDHWFYCVSETGEAEDFYYPRVLITQQRLTRDGTAILWAFGGSGAEIREAYCPAQPPA